MAGTHIYDWIVFPDKTPDETYAREWFYKFTVPAVQKDYEWLTTNKLFCTYDNKRYRVVGASRMGDVWLSTHFYREHGYERRIEVDGCSAWSKDA